MSLCTRDITKETVRVLSPAPFPEPGTVLQIRAGKAAKLGPKLSAIVKNTLSGPVYLGPTGIAEDEHVYHTHGGTERAVMAYDSAHYADWREEQCPNPELFQLGGFGENLVTTNMSEENICVGDIYRVGKDVLLEVSEPRNPCEKINLRFQWGRALKRVTRTGRVGWLMRVKKTGFISPGDPVVLVERPYPRWSCLNVKRVIQAKQVDLSLVHEITTVAPLTEMVRNYGISRLERTPKRYKLAASRDVTARVKQLTFELAEPFSLKGIEFPQFSFAQINLGGGKFSRSYSIVSGNMQRFSLGVALDDHSRGGSAYIHQQLKLGDEITMKVGGTPQALQDEDRCIEENLAERRLVIVGGIGVTAFLPSIQEWEAKGYPYEIHYAARSREDAAFLDFMPAEKTTIYAKTLNQRLNVDELIPKPETTGGRHATRIYCCGPTKLMDAAEARAHELGYPEHLLHFESFGADAGGVRGDPFTVVVDEPDSGRKERLNVPADKSLLQVLRDVGFDMSALCEVGGCGACKVALCGGKVEHKGSGLQAADKANAMLSCVSRGIGEIQIELD